MKTFKFLLIALCALGTATLFGADPNLQIQDPMDASVPQIDPQGIMQQYEQMQQDLVGEAFSDPFFKQAVQLQPNLQLKDAYPQTIYKKTKDTYLIIFITPGMPKEDISITINDRILTVTGKYSKKIDNNNKASSYIEQISKQFSQSTTIPDDAIPSKINSKYENGVLTITIPRDVKKSLQNTVKIPVQ